MDKNVHHGIRTVLVYNDRMTFLESTLNLNIAASHVCPFI